MFFQRIRLKGLSSIKSTAAAKRVKKKIHIDKVLLDRLHKKMDEILAELILAHGGTKSSQCENCGSSLIVTWYGVDRWEMRELPPRGGIERK